MCDGSYESAFFLRCYNDIDHITPVISKWIEASHICDIVLTGSPEFLSDYRIEFLSKLDGVRIAHIRNLLPPLEFLRGQIQMLLLVSSLQVSHETIYTAIYAMPRGGCARKISWLRFGHAKRHSRARGEDRRGQIPDRISIHDRPPEIEERLVPGHCEGDLIKGAHNRSAVGTLVERTTLFTVLSRMDNASAGAAHSN